ncbi:MAG: alpha-amylase family glycosyl hydrolase [Anaerolineae bacterium]|nr:MAG: alpha-amylase family glycosyl hydrolase [Anaerolineae bacterium]
MSTTQSPEQRIVDTLHALYGEARNSELTERVQGIIDNHRATQKASARPERLTERDAVLIAYGDQVTEEGEAPLATLSRLLSDRLEGLISGVHILPFFPYSSDDGFSVIDYRRVSPALGTWADIRSIAADFRLMIDAVINHISSESEWAKAFRRGEPEHRETFIVLDPRTDLSEVVRPRDLPLLTPVETAEGLRHVWTTFSSDQFDLNFANPDIMMEILDLLLFYVRSGAQIIRLDAIAYLWKQVGTRSIHMPQTHQAVKLMRAVLDSAAPGSLLITETNVPHEENLSYFGDGGDEAHMVYQFALPPLTLHTLISGDSSRLTEWATDVQAPYNNVTFFNFLASHDGIGLRPAAEILTDEELEALVALPARSQGDVSYRAVPGSGRSPYELNVTYLDALTDPREHPSRGVDRFLTAHAIMLAMPGLPGIYFHSLFGSRNDVDGVQRTGRARSINRQKLDLPSLMAELDVETSDRHRIFEGFAWLLRARASHEAFSPWEQSQVIDVGSEVFGLIRSSASGRRVLCLHEVAGRGSEVRGAARSGLASDLLSGDTVDAGLVRLAPYQSRWIATR